MPNTIIARQDEKRVLEDLLSSNSSEFLAVYGRRRVGKTFLITEFFTQKKCIYMHSTGIKRGTLEQQIEQFMQGFSKTFYQGAPLQVPKRWFDAFDLLTKTIENDKSKNKIVLFLDELPWLVTPRSQLLDALDFYWNRYWVSNQKIKLIICGSSASWIIKNILKNKGGLHNRVTARMRILPFNLKDSLKFLDSKGLKLNNEQGMKLYRCIGGIPHYLRQYKKNTSIQKFIDVNFFRLEGPFFSEYNELFESLFNSFSAYMELVEIIGSAQSGILRSKIENTATQSTKGGQLTTRLEHLQEAGFIQSYCPIDNNKTGKIYRLVDEFCIFYLKWVKPVSEQIKSNVIETYWPSIINTPPYYNWCGYAFETYCFKNIIPLKIIIGASPASFASPWSYRPHSKKMTGTQIDLVIDDIDTTYLCEIKYTKEPFEIDRAYAEKLHNRISVYTKANGRGKQILFVLISAKGVKENSYSRKLVDISITMDDILSTI